MSISDKDKKIKEGFVGQKMIVLPPNIRRSILKNELINRFYTTSIGFYPHATFHNRVRKSGSKEHILLYCTVGSGTVKIKENIYPINPNQFIIIPKNTPHHYNSSQQEPWTIYWVHFMGDNADLLYSRYEQLSLGPVFAPYSNDRLKNFDSIFHLLENCLHIRNVEVANIKTQEFIASFIYDQELSPTNNKNDKVSQSILFMKQHINRQFSVRELAEQQNLSVTHYSRMFRTKTGSSPIHYFSELKIQLSCQHLYFTDKSIKQICIELGFNDPYYFSRLFKNLVGVSPINYRRRHR